MGTKNIVLGLLLIAVFLIIAWGSSWQASAYVDHLKATNPEAVEALLVGILMGTGLGIAIS